jgi:hypothetical protein
LHLADVLADYRQRLEAARNALDPTLDEDGQPAHPIGKRMVQVEGRMLDIEYALRLDAKAEAERERRKGRWRRPARRVRELTSPRLGTLRHHPPRPLTVPTSYLRTEAPHAAPAISVVTPSFAQGRFIERTIYSVVNQRYPALEYVVQDGASTDNTVEVVRRYESELRAWRSEPDAGQGDAINRGFAGTSGEIMAYLNSDDLLLPGSLAYVARYFATHPAVDVVYGHRVMIDEYDRKIGIWVLPPHDDDELALIDFVPQETLFWRRSVWEAAGGHIDPGLRFAVDWDMLLRFREQGAKMVRLPRFLGAFRVHTAQKTSAMPDLMVSECDALRSRVHGQAMSHDQAVARAMPYMRRHVPYHVLERAKERLPLPRQPVRVMPLEPRFRAQPEKAVQTATAGTQER